MVKLVVILLLLSLTTSALADFTLAARDSWSYVHLFGSFGLVETFEALGFSPICAWCCVMTLGILNEVLDKNFGGRLWFDERKFFDPCDVGFNMIGCNLAIFLHKQERRK